MEDGDSKKKSRETEARMDAVMKRDMNDAGIKLHG